MGITRAKSELYIHTSDKNPIFNNIADEYLESKGPYNTDNRRILVMTLRDIWLDNAYSQDGIKATKPLAGEKCEVRFYGEYIYIYKNKHQIAALSDKMCNKIRNEFGDYEVDSCEIEYVIEHKAQNMPKPLPQCLCKIYMKKRI